MIGINDKNFANYHFLVFNHDYILIVCDNSRFVVPYSDEFCY